MAGVHRALLGRLVRAAVLVVLALVCASVAFGLVQRQRAAGLGAEEERSAYPAPTLSTDTVPLVSVIGDQTSGELQVDGAGGGTSGASWISEVPVRLSIRLSPFIVSGSGYLTTGVPAAVGGSTFTTRAGGISDLTRVVVLFGGTNDRGASASAETAAAAAAITAARQIAPSARIVVIGPAWSDGDPPDDLVTIERALKSAATSAKAEFVDPIAGGWLRSDGSWTDAGVPTASGQRELASRIGSVLSAVFDGS